jgi:ATP-dependent helicase HrpB
VRKVVLATSIAETSLTIEGIRVVVDSGFARSPRFDPRTGLTRLETLQVTGDAADQRAGRAGRLGPGVCYRLWREGAPGAPGAAPHPRNLEADLAPTVLELAQWGVKDLRGLAWLTPPPAGAVAQARELLGQLGALDGDRITERGKAMLRLPTHPRLAHLLLEGRQMKLAALAADLAALLEERDPLPREAGADLTLRVEALRNWREGGRGAGDRTSLERTERLASAWRRMLELRTDNAHPAPTQVGRLLAAAYPERVARKREGNSCSTVSPTADPCACPNTTRSRTKPGWRWPTSTRATTRAKSTWPPRSTPTTCATAWTATRWWTGTRQGGAGGPHRNPPGRHPGGKHAAGPHRRRPAPGGALPGGARRRAEGAALDEGTAEWQARVLSLRTWRPDEPWPDVSANTCWRRWKTGSARTSTRRCAAARTSAS